MGCVVLRSVCDICPALSGLVGSLVHQLCHPIPDAFAVLQHGLVNPPLIQAALADVSEELWSPGEQNVVSHDHGALPQQTRALQHL